MHTIQFPFVLPRRYKALYSNDISRDPASSWACRANEGKEKLFWTYLNARYVWSEI